MGIRSLMRCEAFATNWIAPLGPHVDAFEREFCEVVGSSHAAALSSGTAALHLGLLLGRGARGRRAGLDADLLREREPDRLPGWPPGVHRQRAGVVEHGPGLLAEELDRRARAGRLPKAVVLVHLYGQSADIDPILEACERHGVALVEDAAEALGPRTAGVPPGRSGRWGSTPSTGTRSSPPRAAGCW
jgi:dTDP-4-amino-4,6-dideoxygalactose transaminase